MRENIGNFNIALMEWYRINRRELPWRRTKDPYLIWVSEIMLQQTQVKTVIDYYKRFAGRFPTVLDLADAELDEVYKYWEGLGYYSRARNLHTSAQTIRDRYSGEFPAEYEAVRALKGIGSYTAGAIMSIAYGEKYPAVDGNVLRVISRIRCLEDDIADPKTKRKIESELQETMDERDPASFNQALMELGALICTSRNPKCPTCPIPHCRAKERGLQHLLPVKSRKTSKKIVNYVAAFIRDEKGRLLLRKRPALGLLGGLYELPQVEVSGLSPSQVQAAEDSFRQICDLSRAEIETAAKQFRHVFSHRIWETVLLKINGAKATDMFYEEEEWRNLAISTAHMKLIDYALRNVDG